MTVLAGKTMLGGSAAGLVCSRTASSRINRSSISESVIPRRCASSERTTPSIVAIR